MVHALAGSPGADGQSSRSEPAPGPLLVTKEKTASMTSRPATTDRRGVSAAVSIRNSPARTSLAKSKQSRDQPVGTADGLKPPGEAEQISPVTVADEQGVERAVGPVLQRTAEGAHPIQRDFLRFSVEPVQHSPLDLPSAVFS